MKLEFEVGWRFRWVELRAVLIEVVVDNSLNAVIILSNPDDIKWILVVGIVGMMCSRLFKLVEDCQWL